jgi:hypothetical protein
MMTVYVVLRGLLSLAILVGFLSLFLPIHIRRLSWKMVVLLLFLGVVASAMADSMLPEDFQRAIQQETIGVREGAHRTTTATGSGSRSGSSRHGD